MIRPLFFFLSLLGIIASSFIQAQSSFYIKRGGLVSIKDSTQLTLKNISLVNDGEFQAGAGIVSFIEDSSHSLIEIKGKRPVALNNVRINLRQSELTLAQTVNIKGFLQSVAVTPGISHLKLSIASQAPGTYIVRVRSHSEEVYNHFIMRIP